jgi:hypothetical protein
LIHAKIQRKNKLGSALLVREVLTQVHFKWKRSCTRGKVLVITSSTDREGGHGLTLLP